jgi:hypothetical protein
MSTAIQDALELGAYACQHKPLDVSELLRTLAQARLGELRVCENIPLESVVGRKRELPSCGGEVASCRNEVK